MTENNSGSTSIVKICSAKNERDIEVISLVIDCSCGKFKKVYVPTYLVMS